MTLFLNAEDIASVVDHDIAVRAATEAVTAERDGETVIPRRLDVPLAGNLLRVMPAAVGPHMGLKIMTLVRGLGTRYLILLYDRASSELVGLLDAEEITRLRTAATTVVAAGMLQPEPQRSLALLGTGFEAAGHLEAFAHLWPLEEVHVYSPSEQRREAFAARMSEQTGVAVVPVASRAVACGSSPTVVLATKSEQPVVDGRDFRAGQVILSIGSTRPDLRELDLGTLARAATLLVDSEHQVSEESGDIIEALACGALVPERLVGMARATDRLFTPDIEAARDLLVFKSVGTAVQDLTLSAAALAAALAAGVGRELGELTRLKPFAATATAVSVQP